MIKPPPIEDREFAVTNDGKYIMFGNEAIRYLNQACYTLRSEQLLANEKIKELEVECQRLADENFAFRNPEFVKWATRHDK